MLFLLVVIIVFMFYILEKEDFRIDGGRRQKVAETVNVIGPMNFIFFKGSKKLPQLLLFGEQHEDRFPSVKGVKVLKFIKDYIKIHPDTHVFLEQNYDYIEECGPILSDGPGPSRTIYPMIKKDKKRYYGVDNRGLTKICYYNDFRNGIAKDKELRGFQLEFIEDYVSNDYDKMIKKIVKTIVDTDGFQKRFHLLNTKNKAIIRSLISMLFDKKDKISSYKYFRKNLDGKPLYDFMLRITTPLNDIEIMARILYTLQKYPNRHIIMFYGMNHVLDIEHFINEAMNIKTTFSTKPSIKGYVTIPTLDNYF